MNIANRDLHNFLNTELSVIVGRYLFKVSKPTFVAKFQINRRKNIYFIINFQKKMLHLRNILIKNFVVISSVDKS